ncbi:MAG: arginine deiminase family protein [Candidatus Promineifilaceae bacterium]
MINDNRAMTSQSETGRISKIFLKHVNEAFMGEQVIDRQWEMLNYSGRPDFSRAVVEYDRFADFLRESGIDVQFLAEDSRTNLDSIYVRDASVICDKGAILCNMGKGARQGEPAAIEQAYKAAGFQILGTISGEGLLEGGDVVWIDERTIIVGQGYRTNAEGIRQMKNLLSDCVDEVVVAQLPHWRGPADVFHLMSVLSPVDHDKTLVYSPLMPVVLRQMLLVRGHRLIEVPDEEFESMACNVLAIAPSQCLMLSGNPKTRALLEKAGVHVHEYAGDEISVKGAGGPTCLTRPTLRESMH